MKMDIFGVGVDIVEIAKIKEIIRRNRRFLTRVYSPGEIAYCEKKSKKCIIMLSGLLPRKLYINHSG